MLTRLKTRPVTKLLLWTWCSDVSLQRMKAKIRKVSFWRRMEKT